MPSNKLSGRRGTPLRPHVCHSPPTKPKNGGSGASAIVAASAALSTKHTTPIPAQSGRCWPKPTPPPDLHLHVEFADAETEGWGTGWEYDNPWRVWYEEDEHPDTVDLTWEKTETNPDPKPLTCTPDGEWHDCDHTGEAEPPATFTTKLAATDGTNTASGETQLHLYAE